MNISIKKRIFEDNIEIIYELQEKDKIKEKSYNCTHGAFFVKKDTSDKDIKKRIKLDIKRQKDMKKEISKENCSIMEINLDNEET
ncbi:MAG: hypothetical protein ACFFG0_04585 [Candidatus Thorarchaeota archaeon]